MSSKTDRIEKIVSSRGHGWQLWPKVPYVFSNTSKQKTYVAIYSADDRTTGTRIAVVVVEPGTQITVPASEDWAGEQSITHERFQPERHSPKRKKA